MIYFVITILIFVMLALLLWPIRQQRKLCAAIAIIFVPIVFGLYHQFGTPEILPLLAERDVKLATLKDHIATYSAEVKTNPNHLKAWVMLGDSFMETSQYAGAANAYKRSVLLSQGNPILIMAYARALIAQADGNVTDDASKSLKMALILEPQNAEARYFLIVRKLQQGDTQAAMKEMKALYKTLPDDSPLKAMIDRQIGRK